MTDKIEYTWEEMATVVMNVKIPKGIRYVYGIPRGGCSIATAICAVHGLTQVEQPHNLDDTLIVDDIADSGKTLAKYSEFNKFVLVMKDYTPCIGGLINSPMIMPSKVWIHFPWEKENETVQDNIVRLLTFIGENPNREGLRDTPKRVIKSYETLFGGYKQDPAKVLERTFLAENYDEMVIVKNIKFYSNCEHHMLPFFGMVHVGYIPQKGEDGRIVGLSKIPRVVEIFARRLQNQERFGRQIADCIQETLKPLGVGVIVDAQHFCMMSRGVQQQEASMITSTLLGTFRDPEVRSEFLKLTRGD